jgi:hypothetical protein
MEKLHTLVVEKHDGITKTRIELLSYLDTLIDDAVQTKQQIDLKIADSKQVNQQLTMFVKRS